MSSSTETYRERLAQLKAEGRLRALPAAGYFRYDLSDNDYLGLGRRDDLRRDFMARCEAPLTAAASRLLAPRQKEAVELENTLADAYGRLCCSSTPVIMPTQVVCRHLPKAIP